METKVKMFFDPEGNTLTVWFGDPDQEHICEETDDDVILMKDQKGRVIGFEKLNFTKTNKCLQLTQLFTKSKSFYFKHFIYLNYFFEKNTNLQFYILFYFFNNLKNQLFNINDTFLSRNFFFLLLYFKNFLNKSLYISLYRYNLRLFYKKWKILKYFFLPKKLQFNKFFLKKFIFLIDVQDFISNVFLNINKNYYFLNLLYSQLFESKFSNEIINIGNLILENIYNFFSYPVLSDFNLSVFL